MTPTKEEAREAFYWLRNAHDAAISRYRLDMLADYVARLERELAAYREGERLAAEKEKARLERVEAQTQYNITQHEEARKLED